MMKKFFITLCLLAYSSAVFASSFDPSTEAKLQYNRGVDLYKVGQYDRAMASFRQAINLDPNYIDAYYNLGSILEYLKQEEAALAVFKQIIVRKPDDYESVYKAANLSNKLGQIDNAKSYLSLIPPESMIYSKAQKLATTMSTDMQTIKAEEAKQTTQEQPKIDETNAMYNNIASPTGITTDGDGNVYVACFADNMIYKITPDGKRIIFVKDAKINGPIDIASDVDGNIYVTNYNANNVLKISQTGSITVLISNVKQPYGLHINNNMLFVSSQGSNSVLKYNIRR